MVATTADGTDVTYASGEETRFSTAERVQVPESGEVSGPTGTVSFRFEPEWSGDDQADASLVDIGNGRLSIRKDLSFLRFEMTADNGTKTGAEFSLGDWQAGQAYHITASWDGGNMLLYVDGKLVARQHYTNQFGIPPEAPVFVGSDPGPAPIAPGSLSNLQLSQEALGPGDVAVRADPALPKTN